MEKNAMETMLSLVIANHMIVEDPLDSLVPLEHKDSLVLMDFPDPKDILDKMVLLVNKVQLVPLDPKDLPVKLDPRVILVSKVLLAPKDLLVLKALEVAQATEENLDSQVRLVNLDQSVKTVKLVPQDPVVPQETTVSQEPKVWKVLSDLQVSKVFLANLVLVVCQVPKENQVHVVNLLNLTIFLPMSILVSRTSN